MAGVAMTHVDDPKKTILEEVGDISLFELYNVQVLVGVYQRPEKTKGGIILTQNYRDEDNYQGKVGLILKIGPKAFDETAVEWFDGKKLAVGDWVVFRPSDGWACTITGAGSKEGKGKLCRIINDTLIKARIPHPDMVW